MYHQSIKSREIKRERERVCVNDGYLLEVSLASSNMERIPATVVSVVAAPGAAHGERPAHQHHVILGGSSGSRTGEDLQPQIQSNGAMKRNGGK
jgi:hypothetical protein